TGEVDVVGVAGRVLACRGRVAEAGFGFDQPLPDHVGRGVGRVGRVHHGGDLAGRQGPVPDPHVADTAGEEVNRVVVPFAGADVQRAGCGPRRARAGRGPDGHTVDVQPQGAGAAVVDPDQVGPHVQPGRTGRPHIGPARVDRVGGGH